MLGKVAGGLAALGLIGGVGSVAWHDGSATVKVKGDDGVTRSTTLPMDGAEWRCPAGEQEKLSGLVEEMGRIKITIESMDQWSNPERYDALVAEFNADVEEYNATLREDCEEA